MHKLFLQVQAKPPSNVFGDCEFFLSLESFIALYIYNVIQQPENIEVNLIERNVTTSCWVKSDLTGVNFTYFSDDQIEDMEVPKMCILPILHMEENIVIAGLCGVCRGMIKKNINKNKFNISLLGFKRSCLLAPTSASIWTKFCEIDIISAVKEVNQIVTQSNNLPSQSIILPKEFSLLENHMAQPVRGHNLYKLAREIKRKHIIESRRDVIEVQDAKDRELGIIKQPRAYVNRPFLTAKEISSSTPMSELNIAHTYMEGHKLTLADCIVFSCVKVIFALLDQDSCLEPILPNTIKWYNTLKNYSDGKLNEAIDCMLIPQVFDVVFSSVTIPTIDKTLSLYKVDSKQKDKFYTRQDQVDIALEKINATDIKVSSEETDTPGKTVSFDWDMVPFEALPEGGLLPFERFERKKDQIECMAKEIIAMARDGDRIVDFCSGTGHLAILLAFKLPLCQIVLLENKESSLKIAKDRAEAENLKLTNILYVQSNLDYFCYNFNIGTSLHACGVATDIVLDHCLDAKANFVICPCCYGGMHEMPHIPYPRSKSYRKVLTTPEYIFVAHCADQSHDIDKGNCNVDKSIQGEFCMDVIDTDRKLLAEEEFNYSVILSRLIPEKCTPKNRLLIGRKN